MKNLKLNKKGFTLVELLAVIVILALLIVITANTVLPMMNRSTQSGMVTYAERVLSRAGEEYQIRRMSGGDTTQVISLGSIMENSEYKGCVMIEDNAGEYKYSLLLYSESDDMAIEGYTTTALIRGVEEINLSWEGTYDEATCTQDNIEAAATDDLTTVGSTDSDYVAS